VVIDRRVEILCITGAEPGTEAAPGGKAQDAYFLRIQLPASFIPLTIRMAR
jgi:hypothetical protein